MITVVMVVVLRKLGNALCIDAGKFRRRRDHGRCRGFETARGLLRNSGLCGRGNRQHAAANVQRDHRSSYSQGSLSGEDDEQRRPGKRKPVEGGAVEAEVKFYSGRWWTRKESNLQSVDQPWQLWMFCPIAHVVTNLERAAQRASEV